MGGRFRPRVDKAEKEARKLEYARLAKAHGERNGAWTSETVKACDALADRWLGHGVGRRSDKTNDLRSHPAVCEIPASHMDFNALSPIVHLIP